MSGARALGYQLLGARLDYLLHLRPAEWPIMAGHTALGTLLAVGVPRGVSADLLGAPLAGLLLWVVCLNGGTLAINSAFDRDEGDIAYLRRPPPPPRGLFAFGLALMLAGQGAACLLPWPYPAVYAICLVLSVLYSVPPFRLKARAGWDWLINMWGFGTLTPLAGWAATGRPLDLAGAWVLFAFCPLFAALYPLTQLYQMEEDRARGDDTLALRFGLGPSLAVAIACAVLAFACLGVAAGLADGAGRPVRLRLPLLAVALAAWLGVLVPWYLRRDRWAPADHQRGMHRALGAWAVTDLAVLLAFGVPHLAQVGPPV